MLQKVDNVSFTLVRHKSTFLRRKLEEGHFQLKIGKSVFNFPTITGAEEMRLFANEIIKSRTTTPYCFNCGGVSYWLFKNKFYKDTDGLNANEVAALLVTRHKLKQNHINRARSIASLVIQPEKNQRGSIADDVKLLVWERDRGICVKCGSNVEIQYDHIIPFSLGGSSTPENLQILCGSCNRLKGASVV